MKRVLLITYYWPPSGGAGVQRVLKMVKYFRDFGWEPVVFTAKDAAYPVLDKSLLKDVPEDQEVVRGNIWEPYELYRRFIGQKGNKRVYSGFLSEDKKPSLTQRISVWIRGNLFIPDARRFWIKPSVKLLRKQVKDLKIDAILSSGPPHSVHLIARGVKRATGLPWIADFRDPWTNIDFYDQLMLSPWADQLHHRLEASVVKECDRLVTVSWSWAKEFREMGGGEKVKVITNGFDPADFEFDAIEPDSQFVINHIGYLNTDRNPPILWQALGELCQEDPQFKQDLRLRFIGKTDRVLFQHLEMNGLSELTESLDYVPHEEVLSMLPKAQVLLLLINNTPNVMGVIPGKIYEYLASRRPILAISPADGDSARIIKETNAGVVCGFDDLAGIKTQVKHLYQAYQQGSLKVDAASIDRFSRKTATGQMAEQLNGIT